MSPEATKEKLTVTAEPPPAAKAFEKAATKKRSEAENLLDGHAATIKGEGKLTAEAIAARMARDGRVGGFVGFALCTLVTLWVLLRHGGMRSVGLTQAYHALEKVPWFFETSTRMVQLRIFGTAAAVFLLAAVLFPRSFGAVWMRLAAVLGWVNTRLLLGLFYYVLVTPWGLLLRIRGVDPLRREKHDGSYWLERTKKRPPTHFERLF